jgi:preprotein translocase subunit SecG
MWQVLAIILSPILLLMALFMILLILIQRGKGGGLAGALGGAGGSSAFGTRAGDQFTRITVYVALFWIFLIMLTIKVTGSAAEVTTGKSKGEGSGSQLYRLHHHHGSDHPSAVA